MPLELWHVTALRAALATIVLAIMGYALEVCMVRRAVESDLVRSATALTQLGATEIAHVPNASTADRAIAVGRALARQAIPDGPQSVCWYAPGRLPLYVQSSGAVSEDCPPTLPQGLATPQVAKAKGLGNGLVGVWVPPESVDAAGALVMYAVAGVEARRTAIVMPAMAGAVTSLATLLLLLLLLFVVPAYLAEVEVRRILHASNNGQSTDFAAALPALPLSAPSEVRRVRQLLTTIIVDGARRTHHAARLTALLSQALAGMREVIFITDRDGVVKYANRRAVAVVGRSRGALRGTQLAQLLPDLPALGNGQMPVALAALVESDHQPAARSPSMHLRCVDGEMVPVALHATVAEHGKGKDFCVYLQDRREELARESRLRAAIDKARAANEAKSSFLANMSHEIRTPLNGITGMTDLLASTQLTEDQRDLLNTLRSSSKILRRLLNDILDLSKIEAGEVTLESLPFDVHEQILLTVESYRAATAAKGLRLTFDSHAEPRILMGDPFRISQVLNNLIDNAVKFTESGGIDVQLGVVATGSDNSLADLTISVQDTGPGLPPNHEQVLFTPFRQADNSTTRRFGGTGLGLALCRQLCKVMGGEIRAESKPDKGSTFIVSLRLPVALGMSPFVDSDLMSEPIDLSVLQGAHVLVVDDNRVNQTLLCRWLKAAGMTAEVVANGELAVEAAARSVYDCILMDLSMPVMSGIDATRAIRALKRPADGAPPTNSADTPIVGVSAMALPGDRRACVAAGMNEYVTKPIKRDELITAMLRAKRSRSTPISTIADGIPRILVQKEAALNDSP